MGNKVKYNLKNVYYSKVTETNGTETYATPVAIPGAVSLSLEPKGEPSKFFADGYAYYTVNNNGGYEGDLEIAIIPDSFAKEILGESEHATDKTLTETTDGQASMFALLFQFDGDVKGTRYVLYNCSASRPKIEGQTNEEDFEVKTDTLSIVASPRSDGKVKSKTTTDTPASTYDGWFTAVYVPAVAASNGGGGSTQE